MTSITNVQLPKSVFNRTLYNRIHTLWFADLPSNATSPGKADMARWFGLGGKDVKTAFDAECSAVGLSALEILGPEKFLLPKFISFDTERREARSLSAPLAEAIANAKSEDVDSVDAGLSFVLLLDQLSRNCFRDQTGQAMVYNHYDRLARALSYSMLGLSTGGNDLVGLDKDHKYINSPAHRVWLYMPLMHSESLGDHELFEKELQSLKNGAEERGDEGAREHAESSLNYDKMHKTLLERFGRYPHRNDVLGRKMSEQETAFLAEGGSTFGTS